MMIRKITKAAAVVCCLLVAFAIAPASAYGESSFSEETIEPTRTINLVYDDSTSMIQSDSTHQFVDTWCQAKYAVEAFAAMLGEKDSLNVYVMSDYDKPHLSLSGKNSASANVKKVHGMKTKSNATPFESVKQAMNDLKSSKSDEKWLVVLTDGQFQRGGDVDGYFAKKPKDVKVMFLGMGPDAGKIREDAGKNIFFKKAKTSKDILDELTTIGQQVFNRAKLEVKGQNTVEFDIPMKELIVFAQGEGVKVSGIKDGKGNPFNSSESALVTYTESKDATSNTQFDTKDIICDKSLQGNVAVFRDGYAEGSYTIDLKGAGSLETIEVYYKPDVKVSAHLKNSKGKEVKGADLKAGDYTVDFSMVKGTTGEEIKNSPLLEPITYEADLYAAGQDVQRIQAGDAVTIGEGDLHIDARAKYLDRYTVSTSLDKSIYKNKGLAFTVKDDPGHTVKKDGFEGEDPLVLKAELDGRDFTEEEWARFDEKKVTIDYAEETKTGMDSFRVEKGQAPGDLNVYPVLPEEIKGETYTDLKLNASYQDKVGKKETWKGADDFAMKISDDRSWFDKHRDLILKLALLLLALLLFCGYIPPFKKRLPKRLKKKPTITSVPTMIGYTGGTDYGKYTKDMVKPFLPYVAETGTIRFVPKTVRGYPQLKVKAAGGRKMNIMNIRSYAGKDSIRFNGNPIQENIKKPMKVTAGLTIEVLTAGKNYTCTLNN